MAVVVLEGTRSSKLAGNEGFPAFSSPAFCGDGGSAKIFVRLAMDVVLGTISMIQSRKAAVR